MPIRKAVRPSGYKPPRSRETASRSRGTSLRGSVQTIRMEKELEGLISQLREVIVGLKHSTALPTVLSLRLAAHELSCSTSKIKLMVRKGQLVRCPVGDGWGVPREEILRIANTRETKRAPKVRAGTTKQRTAQDARSDAAAFRASLRKRR